MLLLRLDVHVSKLVCHLICPQLAILLSQFLILLLQLGIFFLLRNDLLLQLFHFYRLFHVLCLSVEGTVVVFRLCTGHY